MPAHPDSNFYPEASGPAKVLVDQHHAEQPLRLYAGGSVRTYLQHDQYVCNCTSIFGK